MDPKKVKLHIRVPKGGQKVSPLGVYHAPLAPGGKIILGPDRRVQKTKKLKYR